MIKYSMSRKHQLGSFFLAISKDDPEYIAATLYIPKKIDFPWIGSVSAELVGFVVAGLAASYIIWKGQRTYRNIRNYIKDLFAPLEIEEAKKTPAKAKTWGKTNPTKLDEFIDTCKDAKKGLRKVEDPDSVERRIAKRNKIRLEDKTKPKGKLGLSDDLLKNTRGELKAGGLDILVQRDAAAKDLSADERRRTFLIQDEQIPLLQNCQEGLLRSSGSGSSSNSLVLKDAANISTNP
jgi:hypothetical protein